MRGLETCVCRPDDLDEIILDNFDPLLKGEPRSFIFVDGYELEIGRESEIVHQASMLPLLLACFRLFPLVSAWSSRKHAYFRRSGTVLAHVFVCSFLQKLLRAVRAGACASARLTKRMVDGEDEGCGW